MSKMIDATNVYGLRICVLNFPFSGGGASVHVACSAPAEIHVFPVVVESMGRKVLFLIGL